MQELKLYEMAIGLIEKGIKVSDLGVEGLNELFKDLGKGIYSIDIDERRNKEVSASKKMALKFGSIETLIKINEFLDDMSDKELITNFSINGTYSHLWVLYNATKRLKEDVLKYCMPNIASKIFLALGEIASGTFNKDKFVKKITIKDVEDAIVLCQVPKGKYKQTTIFGFSIDEEAPDEASQLVEDYKKRTNTFDYLYRYIKNNLTMEEFYNASCSLIEMLQESGNPVNSAYVDAIMYCANEIVRCFKWPKPPERVSSKQMVIREFK